MLRGVAYGTRCDRHLLNVPAGLMSALPDEPSHFLGWLSRFDPSAAPETFAPRRLYGEYLEDLLCGAVEGGRVALIQHEVAELEVGSHAALRMASGGRIVSDVVVLALGNPPPSVPLAPAAFEGLRGFVANPWSRDALDGLAGDEAIGLIGTTPIGAGSPSKSYPALGETLMEI